MSALDLGGHGAEVGGTTLDVEESAGGESASEERRLALVVIWWRGEPERVGEVLLPGAEPAWFGRATGDTGVTAELSLSLSRQRPGKIEPALPVTHRSLSRRHLRLTSLPGSIGIECAGRQPLCVAGKEQRAALARAMDVVEIRGVCSFLCVPRPRQLEAWGRQHEFGRPDADGIVGESSAIWQLRRRLRFVAGRAAHVLITGPSGTGKELAARAIHAQSKRCRKAMVARNAATLPSSLIDAELYGNAANYPNPGMAERPGLIGQAEGSTLFLDEIGELSSDLHAHLLRVLDAGEYQRLGEARTRTADFRFVAATHRPRASLKEDFAARLALLVEVPGLNDHPEDIPLIAAHLVRRIAGGDPELRERFLSDEAGAPAQPRLSAELACALTLHQYSTHVRELESVLWRSMQASPGPTLEHTKDLRELLGPERLPRAPDEVSREDLKAAMERHGGIKERVWRELGLSSRHALLRLMRKLEET